MTEREEYELVAKAAGYEYKWIDDAFWGVGHHIYIEDCWFNWNPKTDSGDSRRLAVDLGISIEINKNFVEAWNRFESENMQDVIIENVKYFADYTDKYAAVRAAVWEVAVEVAKRRMEK